jgi:hypothetical protein
MMNFSSDRDLLAYEPTLFHDLPWAGQQRLRVTDGSTTGTTLSSQNADFEAADVGIGSVVLIEDLACEVLSRGSQTQLTVSLLRRNLNDAAIPPGDGSDQTVVARTFAPQAALVHDQLLHMLGFEPDNAQARVTEQAIVSMSVMARLEALGTLERVFSGAVALVGDNKALEQKAAAYHERFTRALRRATVLLDVDGDGRVDARRGLSTARLVRV